MRGGSERDGRYPPGVDFGRRALPHRLGTAGRDRGLALRTRSIPVGGDPSGRLRHRSLVCLIYLSAAFGVTAPLTGFLAAGSIDWGLAFWSVVALAMTLPWYRAALTGTSYWDATVRALVDVGRKPMAAALGLRLPVTIEEERKMWSLTAAFGFYEYAAEWSGRLDPFRVGSEEASSNRLSSTGGQRGLAARLLKLRGT
jgi:hypothetical protein